MAKFQRYHNCGRGGCSPGTVEGGGGGLKGSDGAGEGVINGNAGGSVIHGGRGERAD